MALPSFTTNNVKNTSELLPDKYITTVDGKKQPVASYKSQINTAVDKNKPDITSCIKQKIKAIIGAFTIPQPVPKAGVADALKDLGNQLKQAGKNIKDTVVNSVKGIKKAIQSTVDFGDLNASKFLGCDSLTVSTPYERKQLANSTTLQDQTTQVKLNQSTSNLQSKSVTMVQRRTSPITTGQSNIATLTTV